MIKFLIKLFHLINKVMKTKNIKCKHCGGKEFISKPNQYDVYVADEDDLELQKSEIVDEKIQLYCRECSEELLNADKLINS